MSEYSKRKCFASVWRSCDLRTVQIREFAPLQALARPYDQRRLEAQSKHGGNNALESYWREVRGKESVSALHPLIGSFCIREYGRFGWLYKAQLLRLYQSQSVCIAALQGIRAPYSSLSIECQSPSGNSDFWDVRRAAVGIEVKHFHVMHCSQMQLNVVLRTSLKPCL